MSTDTRLILSLALLEQAPALMAVFEGPELRLTVANRLYREWMADRVSMIGRPLAEIYPEAAEQGFVDLLLQAMNTREPVIAKRAPVVFDGKISYYNSVYQPIIDEDGEVRRVLYHGYEVTDQVEAEQERARLQEEVIVAQQAALRELSTPLIPIASGVVVLPLIGAIDTNRAQQIMETLLHGIALHNAHTAVIDVTGVSIIDTQVANALIQAAKGVQLLGAKVFLTGVSPDVAQTVVSLGIDFTAFRTYSTLQAGIAAVLS
ncbi:MAG TPA: STAS domain-containing protein [Roseiflexaceae bacterium]|nr:STAS domain-containing protein [Roseiflexaceae bacterium]